MTEDAPMISVEAFAAAHRLSMTAERTARNPHMDDSTGMDHWLCSVKAGELGVDYRAMSVVFSMGKGHHGKPPELADVLDCLASDAAGYENAGSFEEWASDYGLDTDSRKAERTYRTVGKQTGELRRLLGDEAFDVLLWEVERL